MLPINIWPCRVILLVKKLFFVPEEQLWGRIHAEEKFNVPEERLCSPFAIAPVRSYGTLPIRTLYFYLPDVPPEHRTIN